MSDRFGKMRFYFLTALMCTSTLFLAGCQSSTPYHSPWDAKYPQHQNTTQTQAQTQVKTEARPDIGWQPMQMPDDSNTQRSTGVIHPSGGFGTLKNAQTAATKQPSPYDAYRQSLGKEQAQKQKTIIAQPKKFTTPVKVAILLPLSGKHAQLGQSMLNAAQMALFDVGADNFTLIPRDTQGTANGARDAAKSAVAEDVSLIIGPLFATSVSAVQPVAQSRHIPIIAFSTDWRLANQNTYIMGFLPFAQVARVTNYALTQDAQNFAFLAPQNDYSEVVKRTLSYTIGRHGHSIVKEQRFNALQKDLKLMINDFTDYDMRLTMMVEALAMNGEDISMDDPKLKKKLKKLGKAHDLPAAAFDTIMLPMGGEGVKTLSTLLNYFDIDTSNTRFIGTGLWDDPSLTREPGLHGAWFAASDPKLRQDFEIRYRVNFDKGAERLSTLSYDATALAAILARTHNSNGRIYNKSRLTNPRGYAGIDGIFRFRTDGLIERGLAVLEIKQGRIAVIDPAPKSFPSR